MKIVLAKNSGFCFGVKRAMDKALASSKTRDEKIHTLGPLIHNRQAIEFLESNNIYSADTLDTVKSGLLIIRSHGVPLSVYEKLEGSKIEVADATCPYVRKVQEIARSEHEKSRQVVIIGNPKHPEVIGINGWCQNKAIVIKDESNIDSISNYDKISVVAQTTLNAEKWEHLTKSIKALTKDVRLFNTICSATRNRQKSCMELSKISDVMIIIGGFHSSNTQKLYELSRGFCKASHHIEISDQLKDEWFANADTIGISAGASTPDWIIKDVIKKIKIKVGS